MTTPSTRRDITILLLPAALLTAPPLTAQDARIGDIARWEQRAENVTIIRDDWGIPHVYGRTDADAIFGLMYAQAEDGFERIETNYLNALGRLAEAEGESAIFGDLRTRLFIDPDTLEALYGESPRWLRDLMDAWADGLNYYLHTHPEATPRVIRRFEPWMPLAFSEGSITNDVTRIPPGQIESFYGNQPAPPPPAGTERPSKDQDGSNAIAIAPSNTAAGNALLLINPHTSFYFRTEVHVSSEEGLNAYGAATWGQFFLFQGFNDRLGWAHTTSGVDAVDEYLESVFERDGQVYYRYGAGERPVATSTVTLAYRTPDGGTADRTFTVHGSHRGPIIREQDGQWVSIALMRRPVDALRQSFLRMKARDLGSFMAALELKANSTNNTMYADADGNIAFQPPQFIPRRDDRFDFRRPVDGSDPATDWRGVHDLDEAPALRNPASGWIQNTNNWPYSAAGPHSPRREDYPRYMDTFGENPRGVHAVMLLRDRSGFTLDGLRDVAYDSYQPAFAQVIPSLIAAHEEIPDSHPLKRRLSEEVELLRSWDYRWGVESVAMSLGVNWANELWVGFVSDRVPDADYRSDLELNSYLADRTTTEEKLGVLAAVSDRLEKDFGTWRIAWGEVNRFQRLTGQPEQPFSDESPSIPVGFSEHWTGSLATFFAPPSPGNNRRYGIIGNTFVAVIEFGDRVRARAIRPGGQSVHPASPHFNDQSIRYAAGDLRDVYFYRSDLEGHIEREYHPGFEAQRPDTVHVAPPSGVKESDRASISAALERADAGDIVQFAAGTYLIGELIRVTTSRITLRGHPDGTKLRGCAPEDFVDADVALFACNGLELAGGHQTVRDLTFEYAWHGLFVGCCFPRDMAEAEAGTSHRPDQAGGHVIEGNTFRNSSNGLRVVGQSAEPIVIRGNRFVNNFHALAINGGTAHVLGNDVSAPEPERVPIAGHTGYALSVAPTPPNEACGRNVIAGNRVEGHTDAIKVTLIVPGTRCRGTMIRDNTIVTRALRYATTWGVRMGSPADSTLHGVPIAITNVVDDVAADLPPSLQRDGASALDSTIVEGNVIIGGSGLGIEVLRSSGNRIENNTISGISRRDPFPGNTANSTDPVTSGWQAANGAGIWISAGSDRNEVTGNRITDVAAHHVVLEGSENVVSGVNAAGGVLDLGTANRVIGDEQERVPQASGKPL